MKKLSYFAIICLCCICAGCQTSEDILIAASDQANSSCPIKVSKEETITQVEYLNSEVIFHVSVDESEYSFGDYTYQEIKEAERNPKGINRTMKLYLNNDIISNAFKNVSLKVAEDTDLKFKAILKGKKSDVEIVYKMTWSEALRIHYLRILK